MKKRYEEKKMKYDQKIILKNGNEAWLRNGNASDGNAVYEIFNLTHAETDYLLSYPNDDIAFSGLMPEIRFERTGTLGKNADHCDFHFVKNK